MLSSSSPSSSRHRLKRKNTHTGPALKKARLVSKSISVEAFRACKSAVIEETKAQLCRLKQYKRLHFPAVSPEQRFAIVCSYYVKTLDAAITAEKSGRNVAARARSAVVRELGVSSETVQRCVRQWKERGDLTGFRSMGGARKQRTRIPHTAKVQSMVADFVLGMRNKLRQVTAVDVTRHLSENGVLIYDPADPRQRSVAERNTRRWLDREDYRRGGYNRSGKTFCDCDKYRTWRSTYLADVRRLRHEGFRCVYLDESSMHQKYHHPRKSLVSNPRDSRDSDKKHHIKDRLLCFIAAILDRDRGTDDPAKKMRDNSDSSSNHHDKKRDIRMMGIRSPVLLLQQNEEEACNSDKVDEDDNAQYDTSEDDSDEGEADDELGQAVLLRDSIVVFEGGCGPVRKFDMSVSESVRGSHTGAIEQTARMQEYQTLLSTAKGGPMIDLTASDDLADLVPPSSGHSSSSSWSVPILKVDADITKDYHNMFNYKFFKVWFANLLKSLMATYRRDQKFVFIMDNAKYHKNKSADAPTLTGRKADLAKSAMEHGVYRPGMTVLQLKHELKKVRDAMNEEIVDMAEKLGHRVLFTPPHHSDLQPIELVWAIVKKPIARAYSDDSIMDDIQGLLLDNLHSLSSRMVLGCIRESRRKEKALRAQERKFEKLRDAALVAGDEIHADDVLPDSVMAGYISDTAIREEELEDDDSQSK